MDITVVVPLFNEEESLPELYAWIERVMKANDFSFEVIFVNDGSTDHSWEVIEELAEKKPAEAQTLPVSSASQIAASRKTHYVSDIKTKHSAAI